MPNFAVYIDMKKTKAHIICILAVFLLCCLKAEGQDYPWLSHNNIMVEVRAHYGFFWHHHFEMQKFNAHYPAFELSIYQNSFGKNEWEAIYNYPYLGLTFYHANFGLNFEGNDEVGKTLGSVNAIYPFINYPLVSGENAQLTFKLGAGLGLLTKCFDHFDNYQNYAIGSHLNAAVNLSFEYRQRIGSRLMSVASFGLTHFSNGSTKLPNYGLNTFSGAWGLSYYLRDPRINLTPAKRPEYRPFEFDRKKWFYIDVDYGIGFKNVSQTYGGEDALFYRVHDFSVYMLAQFTQCSHAGVGLNMVLDLSDQTLPGHKALDNGKIQVSYLDDDNNPQTAEISPYLMARPNISLCYAMTMNRMSYYFEFGWHLKLQPYTDMTKGNIFQKVNAKYQLYQNIYAHVSLSTHFGRADYLCFGLGYRFNQKYYLNYEKSTRRHPPGVGKRRFRFL